MDKARKIWGGRKSHADSSPPRKARHSLFASKSFRGNKHGVNVSNEDGSRPLALPWNKKKYIPINEPGLLEHKGSDKVCESKPEGRKITSHSEIHASKFTSVTSNQIRHKEIIYHLSSGTMSPSAKRRIRRETITMSRRDRGRHIFQMGLTNGNRNFNSGLLHQMRNESNTGPDLEATEDSLASILLKSFLKKSLCDVEIIGKDGVPVEAPSYLLAAHSEVFEDMIYSDAQDAKPNLSTSGGDESFIRYRVDLEFAEWDSIQASVHFLATRNLPDGLENEASEFSIRYICQIYLFGRLFKIPSLANQAYTTARRLVNTKPSLVCAAFDECLVSTKILALKFSLPSSRDELHAYVLDYLRDSPLTTLLAGGTDFLDVASIEAIICDQDMDVDEHTMFHILNTWVKHAGHRIETGKALVSNINLSYINKDYLNNVVKKCGFVEMLDVEAALKDIEEMLAHQSPDEKEHVLVEGAGNDEINGIYARMDEDIGMGEEEIVFVKEAQEDEDFADYGLYLHGSTWAITTCVDYSNIFYSAKLPEKGSPGSITHSQPPQSGWEVVSGSQPPPTCTWNSSKDKRKSTQEMYVAPDLAASQGKNLSDIANGDHTDMAKLGKTLSTMISLPSDEGHEGGDYR